MAEVVKRGTPKKKVARYSCNGCDSVVDFTEADITSDPRGESYVVCPVCKGWIDTSVLQWQLPQYEPHK